MTHSTTREFRVFDRDFDRFAAGRAHGRRRPESAQEWQAEYMRRMDCYLGLPYELEEIKAMHLFRSVDPNGHIIEQTRRLMRDVAYVCNTDARALCGDGLTLEVHDAIGLSDAARERWQRAGDAVWARSRLRDHIERWALNLAVFGDGHYEAAYREGGSVVVGHAPSHVTVTYDPWNVAVEQALIDMPWFDAPEVDPLTGRPDPTDAALHEYVRLLGPREVRTWEDGAVVVEGTRPNPLGVVPLVHVPFQPFAEPDRGLWAAEGYDDALSLVDSLLTMISATGNRHAYPWVYAKGFKIAADGGVGDFARVINGIPVDGEIGALEANLTGLVAILDAVSRQVEHLRATLPEFTIQAASAAASGEALRVHASALIAKMTPVRQRWYRALGRVTAMAAAMDLGERWAPEYDDLYRVTGGPIVPLDKSAELGRLHDILSNNGITRADYTRHLQAIGYVDTEHDPDEYAVLAMADGMGQLEALSAAALRGMEPAAEDVADDVAPDADDGETDRDV